MQSDFAGKNGFVWFTGVVEDRQEDPLKMGRIQVRIFGWHDEDRNVCPTKDLPWAQILLPVNSNKSFSLPREGEWVFGFFLDGESGQMPVISGVYPGLVSNATMSIIDTTSEKTFTTQTSTKSTTETPSEDKQELTSVKNAFDSIPKPPRLPRFPQQQVEEALGLPTIVKLSREVIEGTAIALTNNVRSIFCSSEGPIAKAILQAQAQIRIAAIAIREGFKKLLTALGFSPSAGGMVETIKSITKYIKQLNDLINDVRDWVKKIKLILEKIIFYIKELKRLVQLLKQLPNLLKNQIIACLKRAYKELKSVVLETLKEELVSGELDELLEAVDDLVRDANDLIREASDIPQLVNQAQTAFSDFTSAVKSGSDNLTLSLNTNNGTLQSDNVALAQLYLTDGSGNVNSELLTLGEMNPREREQLVYNIFPGTQRFSFSKVKMA